MVEVAASAVTDAAVIVDAGAPVMMVMILHCARGAPLELLEEAVDLVLDARRRAGHFFSALTGPSPSLTLASSQNLSLPHVFTLDCAASKQRARTLSLSPALANSLLETITVYYYLYSSRRTIC